MEVKIVGYNPDWANRFYELNIEWLRTYFYVEDFDEEVLSKPDKYIIDPGGFIFFALIDDQVVGTVALMPTEDPNVLELTKMAVDPEKRGMRIGQKLMEYCIAFGKKHKLDGLMLYSNTILENAIHIYRKYGFKEMQLEENSPYERSNIKMLLSF